MAVEEPATRVEDQDWSRITLHARPALAGLKNTTRTLRERGSAARTQIVMRTFGDGRVRFEIGAAGDGAARGWLVRLHLVRRPSFTGGHPTFPLTRFTRPSEARCD